MASSRSRLALNALNFFQAAVQTGFGPFVSILLTQGGWSQTNIGLAFSIGTIGAMAGQVPIGLLLDRIRAKRTAAVVAMALTGVSALVLVIAPQPGPVFISEAIHGVIGCVLGQSVASMTLALVGREAFAEQIGVNARFASAGAAFAASLLGLLSAEIPANLVLLMTAAFTAPAIAAIIGVRARDLDERNLAPALGPGEGAPVHGAWRLLLREGLPAFAACALLFQLANAAMLQLALNELTLRAGRNPGLVIAGALIIPQLIVAAFSPLVGRSARRFGRRPLLILACVALPIRALVFASAPEPGVIVLVEVLDGVGAAVFGVMVPLVAADVSRRTGSMNLTIGLIGLSIGIGATLSTFVAGAIADTAGPGPAFVALAAAGGAATLLAWLIVPETKQ